MRAWNWRAPLIAGAIAFSIDQASKWLMVSIVMAPPVVIPVAPFLNLTLGYNTGVSFGLLGESLREAPWVLGIFGLIIASGMIWWAMSTSDRVEAFALGSVIGGALGNIVDRWRIGAVVDFLDVYYGDWHWPTFNLADVAIFVGVASLLVRSMWPRRRANPPNPPADAPAVDGR